MMFCSIPKAILADMSVAEVEQIIVDLRNEAGRLEDWNIERPAPAPQPGFFDSVPPPTSAAEYDWRVRTVQPR